MVVVPPSTKTPEQILEEYRSRATNIARWQAQLAQTSDPAQRQYLQGLITSEQNILADLTTEATAAGITPAQLNQAATDAQTAAANDPIQLQEWDGGEYTWDNFVWGGIVGGLQGGAAAIDGALPFIDPFAWIGAYDDQDSTLQTSQALGGFARNTLLLAAGAWAWNAAGGGQFSVILTNGASKFLGMRLPHVMFAFGSRATGSSLAHAVGSGGGIYVSEIASIGHAYSTLGAGQAVYYGSVSGIPILYPTAVAAFAGTFPAHRAATCVSGAWRAYLHGLGRGW